MSVKILYHYSLGVISSILLLGIAFVSGVFLLTRHYSFILFSVYYPLYYHSLSGAMFFLLSFFYGMLYSQLAMIVYYNIVVVRYIVASYSYSTVLGVV